jgi:hypothetical protein
MYFLFPGKDREEVTMRHQPVICILDKEKERCLREEKALEAAIAAKGLHVVGIANYGANALARTGLERFPAIEVDGVYFTSREEGELRYDQLCDFLDMLVRRKIIAKSGEGEIPPAAL